MMTTPNAAVIKVLKRLHYPLNVVLTCVRWYVPYPLGVAVRQEGRAMAICQGLLMKRASRTAGRRMALLN